MLCVQTLSYVADVPYVSVNKSIISIKPGGHMHSNHNYHLHKLYIPSCVFFFSGFIRRIDFRGAGAMLERVISMYM